MEKVVLSVNGEDGILLAQGLRRGEEETIRAERALHREEGHLDGLPGINANITFAGSPAGALDVELGESGRIDGGIRVNVIDVASTQQPPASVDIPVGRDVEFTAIGGGGEPGQNGGDGEDGQNGRDGERATEVADATDGGDAGSGGNAGRGTSGGDGGNGGAIRIRVHENNLHLLIAVSSNVAGGKGGPPGQHGRPGAGGMGGKGGAAHKWTAIVGYKYKCTLNCIGGHGEVQSKTLVRVGTRLSANRAALVQGIGTQTVIGGNLPDILANAAARWGALRHQRADPNVACRCRGGNAHCTGCEPAPIEVTLQRIPGMDGAHGQPGMALTTSLLSGLDGQDGSTVFAVRKADNTEEEYSTIYNLELVDFDLEDENGDGIFEPGEHLFIRRIRVRNTGGMPSPTRPIPIQAVETNWFKPVDGAESQAFLPPSIAQGVTVTLEGSIKVLIRPRNDDELPLLGTQFHRREQVFVNAVMPWLNRNLPNFEFNKSVDLQYPCELRNFRHLATLAQGSTNNIACEVYNRGQISIGSEALSSRKIEVEFTFLEDYGVLQSPASGEAATAVQNLASIPQEGVRQVRQGLRILDDAQCYQHVAVQIDLWISAPVPPGVEEWEQETDPVLVQSAELIMQISDHHIYNSNSSFLLITNSDTTRRARAIQNFIREGLRLEVDTWNVALYGGLKPLKDGAHPILTLYHGKTLLFLGNSFEFFGHGRRSVLQLCDGRWLADAISSGTSCLFLDCADFQAYEDLAKAACFSTKESMNNVGGTITESQKFSDLDTLVRSISDQKSFGSLGYGHNNIAISPRWYNFGKINPKAEAKRASKHLHKFLPQERCLVSYTEPKVSKAPSIDLHGNEKQYQDLTSYESEDLGGITVSIGAPHHIPLVAIEPMRATNLAPPGAGQGELSQFESYMIVASLPTQHRVDILWKSTTEDNNGVNDADQVCSTFAFDGIVLSLLKSIHQEITIVLSEAPWPDNLFPANPDPETRKSLLLTHFPTLSSVLYHTQAANPAVPLTGSILTILRYSLASSQPQRKRHIAHELALPFAQRRSRTRALLTTAISDVLQQKSYSDDMVAIFLASVKPLHSKTDKARRNTGELILKKMAQLTQRSPHAVATGKREASDVVPRTVCVPPEIWDARVQWAEQRASQVKSESEDARAVLAKMIMDAPSRAEVVHEIGN